MYQVFVAIHLENSVVATRQVPCFMIRQIFINSRIYGQDDRGTYAICLFSVFRFRRALSPLRGWGI
jgi:hypothetical protein